MSERSWVFYARPFARRRRIYRKRWLAKADAYGPLSDPAQYWQGRWCAATELWRDFIAHMQAGGR